MCLEHISLEQEVALIVYVHINQYTHTQPNPTLMHIHLQYTQYVSGHGVSNETSSTQ